MNIIHAVAGYEQACKTEGVSAAANAVSEEEKLLKLCGYSVNAVRLPAMVEE